MFFGFGSTATEQKRDKYYKLYKELLKLSQKFDTTLKSLTTMVENYSSSRPSMDTSYIPEDVFGESESNVHSKVILVSSNQTADSGKLAEAVTAAYSRYEYYKQLAIIEEQERTEAERKRKEAAKEK